MPLFPKAALLQLSSFRVRVCVGAMSVSAAGEGDASTSMVNLMQLLAKIGQIYLAKLVADREDDKLSRPRQAMVRAAICTRNMPQSKEKPAATPFRLA